MGVGIENTVEMKKNAIKEEKVWVKEEEVGVVVGIMEEMVQEEILKEEVDGVENKLIRMEKVVGEEIIKEEVVGVENKLIRIMVTISHRLIGMKISPHIHPLGRKLKRITIISQEEHRKT